MKFKANTLRSEGGCPFMELADLFPLCGRYASGTVSGFCKRIGFVKAVSDTDNEKQRLALQHKICISKSPHVA